MEWDQALILVFGVLGVALSQTKGKLQRWACIAGLAGQVGWFHAVSFAQQPGMFLTCCLYAGVWVYGFYNYWIRRE